MSLPPAVQECLWESVYRARMARILSFIAGALNGWPTLSAHRLIADIPSWTSPRGCSHSLTGSPAHNLSRHNFENSPYILRQRLHPDDDALSTMSSSDDTFMQKAVSSTHFHGNTLTTSLSFIRRCVDNLIGVYGPASKGPLTPKPNRLERQVFHL